MIRVKYIRRWKDLYFRFARSEGMVRGANVVTILSVLFMLAWFKDVYLEPKFLAPKKAANVQELADNDAKARQTLFYNRMGAPTRPHRNLEDILIFLAGSKTFDDLSDFASFPAAANINTDQQKGLDSWMSDEDYKMLDYYRESLKHGGGH